MKSARPTDVDPNVWKIVGPVYKRLNVKQKGPAVKTEPENVPATGDASSSNAGPAPALSMPSWVTDPQPLQLLLEYPLDDQHMTRAERSAHRTQSETDMYECFHGRAGSSEEYIPPHVPNDEWDVEEEADRPTEKASLGNESPTSSSTTILSSVAEEE
jgi:hypothetical protein